VDKLSSLTFREDELIPVTQKEMDIIQGVITNGTDK